MSATIIDGKKIAAEIREEIKRKTNALSARGKRVPGLAFVLVGDNPASQVYVRSKEKACVEVGFHSVLEKLPVETSIETLTEILRRLNDDKSIDGILVQMPLPKHLDELLVLEMIDPAKDVDGFHPVNVGLLSIGTPRFVSCTPAGILELLKRSNIETRGAHAVVVGRSNIVGKPVATLLATRETNSVVTLAHTGARDLAYFTRQADILIAAMGAPERITGDMVKEGVVVIDVGMNRITNADGTTKLVGDVHFESVAKKSRAITPVPGGVGPMTIAMLLSNTMKAYELGS